MNSTPIQLIGTWQLARPEWLIVLVGFVIAPAVVLLAYQLRNRRQLKFANEKSLQELAGPKRIWPVILRSLVVAITCFTLAIALSQPQSDPIEIETDQSGRDVIFLLDVSRSMLATDVRPNRLERSKLWIQDLVAELKGDRFALVAFAGSASVRAPLSNDPLFFSKAIDELTPDTVDRGGTNIGDAIRKTMDLVVPKRDDESARSYTDLILITDGEDQESLPVEAAAAAAERGVRIIALGIGSTSGTTIRTPGGTTRTIETKLDSQTLAEIASATPGGAYLEVGTDTLDLPRLYRDLIASAEQATLGQASALQYTERFHWFLWPAFMLIIAERIVIPWGTRRSKW
ncbi:MAG: VWA domain-containing protein [Phycisphaerales bacterium]